MSEHERDASCWRTEWIEIPETFLLLSAALQHLTDTVAGLQVDTARMEQNTHRTRGLLLSEPVMFVLTDFMPLHEAHETVYAAAMRAIDHGTTLREALLADAHVAEQVDRQRLDAALDPRNYTGLAAQVADRVAAKVKAQLHAARDAP